MAFAKGKVTYLWLAGLPFIVVAALLYFRSEKLAGWANVKTGRTLEHWSIALVLIGVGLWVAALVIDWNRSKVK